MQQTKTDEARKIFFLFYEKQLSIFVFHFSRRRWGTMVGGREEGLVDGLGANASFSL